MRIRDLASTYINGVILTKKNLSLKCCRSFEQKMLTTGLRSFQRGAVGLCRSKGYKVTSSQTFEVDPIVRAVHVWFQLRLSSRIFFKPSTLPACNFAAL